ncbi:MAG: hypothetical protein C5B59_02705 [Bacteroidetes bacterium]|nr:MAG: hypothetical protein C5B59_02705 [Bacteroidota bacterium]
MIMPKSGSPILYLQKVSRNIIFLLAGVSFLHSCTSGKQINSQPKENPFNITGLESAHLGVSIYDASANAFLYNSQGDKYFTPASNTKLFSLYAGMKWLGDSLTGAGYVDADTALFIFPAGDPTLLHRDFRKQPVIDFFKQSKKRIYLVDANWYENPWGMGWSWDDYNDDYMPERSALPVYGNVIRWVQEKQGPSKQNQSFDPSPTIYSVPEVNWKVKFTTDKSQQQFFVKRRMSENIFEVTEGNEAFKQQDVPFITNGLASAAELLKDTVGREIFITNQFPRLSVPGGPTIVAFNGPHAPVGQEKEDADIKTIHSQPVDSLFLPMMSRSDNLFAEQTLLMVSNEKLGMMNDARIIDTLLKTDLKELPQKPSWVDGSGLSRFNLFTPQDFVWLLRKMKDEFGMDRMKRLLPTGGKGTLANYYKQDSGYVFAKTGSLTGVICLSGYLYTQKNHLLIFSILVNNDVNPASAARREIEKFVTSLRKNY